MATRQTHYPRLERSLVVLGITLLASLVILAGLTYRLVWDVVAAGRWVSHTHEVRAELEALLGDLAEIETNQRGYLLTGDEGYLGLYADALAHSRERYLRLRALTADNPRQQARFPELERHIQARLTLVDQTIAAMRTSPQEAVRIVRTNRGKEEMAAIRQLVGDMRVEETQLLATRSSYLEDIQRRTFAIILFVIAATAFVTLLLVGYLRANIRRYQHLVLSLDRVTQYKDLLLKEIHHRLNNVLQLVYSIMQLQSRGLAATARQPFEQSLRRVRVVGRTHQSVYGSDSPSDMPVRTLLTATLEDALAVAGRDEARREIIVEAPDIKLGLDVAVPLGLVVSEVVALLAAEAGDLPVLTLAAKATESEGAMSVNLSHNLSLAHADLADDAAALVKGLADQFGAELQIGLHSVRITFAPAVADPNGNGPSGPRPRNGGR